MIQALANRSDFPMLSRNMNGKPLVYLDSAATSLKPESVIQAEMAYYQNMGVNIHRGIYTLSQEATKAFQTTRESVARLIGVKDDACIIFTHGSTESANLVALSWGLKNLSASDCILTTEIEHHSTLVPWQVVSQRTGARLEFIPYRGAEGDLDYDAMDSLMKNGVKIVVLSGMANASGFKPDLKKIVASARRHGALVAVDGAQLASHKKIDVTELDIDFLWFSAHKMLGPTGVGVLWAKRALLEGMDPLFYGGDMIQEVHSRFSSYQGIPEKFEAGTPNIAGTIAFAESVRYLETLGLENVESHEAALIGLCREACASRPWIKTLLPLEKLVSGGILSFNVEGIHSHDIGSVLDSQGVAVRTGFHCAMPYMANLGISGSVRASFYVYSDESDVRRLFEAIDAARAVFA